MAAATTIDDVAPYVSPHPASGVYRYYRRVPKEAAQFDKRVFVRQSLKTKSLQLAQERAIKVHDACAGLWSSLIAGAAAETSWQRYDAAVATAKSLGFEYRTATEIAAGPIDELVARVEKAAEHIDTPQIAAAVLGTVLPEHRVSDIWNMYEHHNADGLAGLSEAQLEAQKKSRERAVRYLIDVIGDKTLAETTRSDALKFRSWWIKKIGRDGLTAYAGNRSIGDIRAMLGVIDARLQTGFAAPWSKLSIVETDATAMRKRPPIPDAFVRDRILAEGALDGLPLQARCIVYIFIETGMRPGGEIANLRPEDIRLAGEPIDGVPFIPHVEVARRTDRRQKSKNAARRIPLVGVALWAARQCPNGFPDFADRGNELSDVVGHYLRERGLLPSPDHVFYSLRHTFSDRLENGGASDRMHADLMGHEFGRPRYGDGPELARRQELLQRIAFNVRWAESAER